MPRTRVTDVSVLEDQRFEKSAWCAIASAQIVEPREAIALLVDGLDPSVRFYPSFSG